VDICASYRYLRSSIVAGLSKAAGGEILSALQKCRG